MTGNILIQNLGIIDYQEAWSLQKMYFQQLLDYKARKSEQAPHQYLIFCEHPHVYTLGKNGSEQNLLLPTEQLRERGATFYQIERGGDITYHGPGQLVMYPILDLEQFGLGLRQYVWLLEESVISCLEDFGIQAKRMEGAPGLWLEQNRKICALGIKASRQVTMHGLALNVNTDLRYFDWIHPCGFQDKGTTSMQKELGKALDMQAVRLRLKDHFLEKLLHAVNVHF